MLSFLLHTRLLKTLSPYIAHFTDIVNSNFCMLCWRERECPFGLIALFCILIKINMANKDLLFELFNWTHFSQDEDKGQFSFIGSRSSFFYRGEKRERKKTRGETDVQKLYRVR